MDDAVFDRDYAGGKFCGQVAEQAVAGFDCEKALRIQIDALDNDDERISRFCAADVDRAGGGI